MKTARTLITICLLFTAASVFAQMRSDQQLMKVNIPFAFGVQDQSLPAGQYLVFTVTPERSIRIVSANGKHSAIFNTLPNYAKEPSSNNWCSTGTATSTSSPRSGLLARTWPVIVEQEGDGERKQSRKT
jgi:hypothetical protein